MHCKCGHFFILGTNRVPGKFITIDESILEDILKSSVTAEDLFLKMARVEGFLLDCPQCGRLWWFKKGFSDRGFDYLPVDAANLN
jgi:hypothetical protein